MSTRSSALKRSSPAMTRASDFSCGRPSATPEGAVMSRYSRLSTQLRSDGIAGRPGGDLFVDCARLVGGLHQHIELRNVVVPFDERRDRAEAPHRMRVEIPHLVAHRMVMGIEQVASMIAMSSKVKLNH